MKTEPYEDKTYDKSTNFTLIIFKGKALVLVEKVLKYFS